MIQHNTPSDLLAQRIHLGVDRGRCHERSHGCSANAINTGAFMVQYTGHGAVPRWSRESIWRTTDVAGLTNTAQLPLVMTFNCLDGYFAWPSDPATFSDTLDAMAEVMQRKGGGGSIAAISPSGLGLTDDQLAFRKILLDVMFKNNVREIGEALRVAKNLYHAQNGPDYPIATEMLFGDPAMRLPQVMSAVAQTDGTILVKWVTATEFDTVAFRLYRAQASDGPWDTIVDAQPAQGNGTTGATYTFLDTDVARGTTYYYLLEDISQDGTPTKWMDFIQNATVPYIIYLPLLSRAN